MSSHSLKQVFHRGGGQASNLAAALDFYYEMPPLIQPVTVPKYILERYPELVVSQDSDPLKLDVVQYQLGIDTEPLLNLDIPEDLKLFELLLTAATPEEFTWYNHMAKSGKYTGNMKG